MKKNKEEIVSQGKLNEVLFVETRRSNGSIRIQQDFSCCPTRADQHSAHSTDLNYLMETLQPDEFAAYIAARSSRPEIIGHDFSLEPDLQTAKNAEYHIRKAFESLSPSIQSEFRSPLDFLKFIDNPDNQEKLIRMGIIKPSEIQKIQSAATPTTSEETAASDPPSASSKP